VNELETQHKLAIEAGANGIEYVLGGWTSDDRIASVQRAESGTGLEFRSMHLPDFGAALPEGAVELVKTLVEQHDIDVVLTHPSWVNGEYPVELYRAMVAGGIPLAIENMDRDKDSGFNVDELARILTIADVGLVLDVQHA
jgi:hypothetical protein